MFVAGSARISITVSERETSENSLPFAHVVADHERDRRVARPADVQLLLAT